MFSAADFQHRRVESRIVFREVKAKVFASVEKPRAFEWGNFQGDWHVI